MFEKLGERLGNSSYWVYIRPAWNMIKQFLPGWDGQVRFGPQPVEDHPTVGATFNIHCDQDDMAYGYF